MPPLRRISMPGRKPRTTATRRKVLVRRPSIASPKKRTRKVPVRTRSPRRRVPIQKVFYLGGSRPLERHPDNPIISPLTEHPWEAHQTFNAGALHEGGKVHLVYRSIGHDGLSRFGYASSVNGLDIDERSEGPIFSPVMDPKAATPAPGWYASGGSWGGSEDPRLTSIGNRIYMLYTGFDQGGFPRVAITSIPKDDFLNQRWTWYYSKFISPPGEVHKNWVLFPERIRGKFAILHSMSPTIDVEYLDDLDFEENGYIKSAAYHRANIPVRDGGWETGIRGPGPTPIKTKYGWLVLYHGTTKDCGYKMGAMLLGLKDPTRVIARADEPILQPAEWYEKEGWKGNIIYSCGAVVIGDSLFVYYGGADSVLCVAKTNLQKFLNDLIGKRKPKVTKRSSL